MRIKLKTHREKVVDPNESPNWDNTIWKEKVARKCRHKWHPVSIEPHTVHNYCYLVCLKCCAYTYIETAFVGYYLNSPDLIEEKIKRKSKRDKSK